LILSFTLVLSAEPTVGGQAVVGHLDIDALGLASIHAHGSPFSNPKESISKVTWILAVFFGSGGISWSKVPRKYRIRCF